MFLMPLTGVISIERAPILVADELQAEALPMLLFGLLLRVWMPRPKVCGGHAGRRRDHRLVPHPLHMAVKEPHVQAAVVTPIGSRKGK